jgi:hypothetical protein
MKCPVCNGCGYVARVLEPSGNVRKEDCGACEGSGGHICIQCEQPNDSEESVVFCNECEKDYYKMEAADWKIDEDKFDRRSK